MIKTKIIRSKGLPLILCLVVAFFLSSFAVSAQQSFPDMVTDQSAEELLEAELPNLIAALDNETEGTAAFDLAERTLNLYNHTWEELHSGKALSSALQSSFNEYSQNASGQPMSSDEMPGLAKDVVDYGDAVFDGLVLFLSN